MAIQLAALTATGLTYTITIRPDDVAGRQGTGVGTTANGSIRVCGARQPTALTESYAGTLSNIYTQCSIGTN